LYGQPPWTKRQINQVNKKLANMTDEEQFHAVQETKRV